MSAPSFRRVGQRTPFAAFVCDEMTAEVLRPVAVELGWAEDTVSLGGIANAVQALSLSASPLVLFVDLADAVDPLNEINALAEVCEPGTVVIATGRINDVRLYRDLLASGIQDYLLKPLDPLTLREALLAAQASLAAPRMTEAEGRPSLNIAVIGVRGGVGASTIATSLAWLLAEREQRPTALLDLDVHFGTAAMAFDLEPGRGLTDALENPDRIDGLFIERAMVRATGRLSILSAEAPITQPIPINGDALLRLQEELRGAFEAVVIDMPRSVPIQHPQLLAELQHVVVVSDLTLAGTRDTIRLLSWLKANAPGAQPTVIANRVPASPPPEVNRRDFEASIEHQVDFAVPFDAKAAVDAAKQGKCLADAAAGSKLTAPITALATSLGGTADIPLDDRRTPSLLGNFRTLLAGKSRQAQ